MKTQMFQRKIFFLGFGFLLLMVFTPVKAQFSSDTFTLVKGHVIDKTTHKGLAYANVYLENTGLGVVANSEGGFILKVPVRSLESKVIFTLLGYQASKMNVKDLNREDNEISLTPQSIQINEVLIRSNDPILLIKNAISNIPGNYGTKPYMATAFYRESIMQNRRYVGVAEAVLEIFKVGYTNDYENDRIKVYKGRKSEDKRYMDTLVMKLKGGHQSSTQMDIAKNRPNFLDEEYFSQYEYKPVTLINMDGNESYVIEFFAKKDMSDALYDGKLYIDINTLAFTKVEFSISPLAMDLADRLLILRKPLDMKVRTIAGNYSVDYRYLNGKWTLNHVHYDLKFKVDKRHHLFSKIYTTTADMVITDKDTVNVARIKYSESIKADAIFIDQVDHYYDKDFWGSYNIIKPEEAIELVVEKISKKLVRNKK